MTSKAQDNVNVPSKRPAFGDWSNDDEDSDLPPVEKLRCKVRVCLDDEEKEGTVPIRKDEPISSSELDYVKEHLEAVHEQVRMMKISNGAAVPDPGSIKLMPDIDLYDYDNFLYGDVPETFENTLVYLKYNFKRKKTDTTKLTIYKMRSQILSTIKNNQVVTIEGSTGCGKTTQVPQFILEEAADNNVHCNVVVTQPRRIAAISIAHRVAEERDWKIGGIVGYQVGLDKVGSDDTRLTYMTTGVLLQQLIARKSLGGWTHIIVDEVHERDVDTDFLLLVIKKLMVQTQNDQVRLILMSATLNVALFGHYFPSRGPANEGAVNVKIPLEGMHPIEEFYLDDAIRCTKFYQIEPKDARETCLNPKLIELAVKLLERLDNMDDFEAESCGPVERGAVLVFLPGFFEIQTMGGMLLEADEVRSLWKVLPLHSTNTSEEQQRVFSPSPMGKRKIILATNIAESSITVPDVRIVIDFCLTKKIVYNTNSGFAGLQMQWASKNECIQRRGRCGRVAPGKLYRLVPQEIYRNFTQEATAEMHRCSLESTILKAKRLRMGSPKSILALAVEPPEESKIMKAVCNLKEVGALAPYSSGKFDAYDGDLTYVGEIISQLPIDFRFGRLIVMGYVFDCLPETVIIAAGLSGKPPFLFPYSKKIDAYLEKLKWSANSFSDCICLLHVYTKWERVNKDNFTPAGNRQWAKRNFVHLGSLKEMEILVDELQRRLKTLGISCQTDTTTPLSDEDMFVLKTAIAGAFYPNYYLRDRIPKMKLSKDYQFQIGRLLEAQDPFNSVYLQGYPEQDLSFFYKSIFDYLRFDNCIPYLDKYAGTKIVAQFASHGNYIGRISIGVYRALKLHQLGQRVSVLDIREIDTKQINAYLTNQVKVLAGNACPEQCALPSLETRRIQFILTYVAAPDDFYIVQASDEDKLLAVNQQLRKCECERHYVGIPARKIQIASMCIVKFDGNLYRGRIDAESNKTNVFVTLIDHGRSVWLTWRDLFVLPDYVHETYDFLKVPALAIKCKLKGVQQPAWNDHNWSSACLREFTRFFCRGTCFMIQIYGVSNGVICGTVFRDGDERSLNDLLLGLKYADCLDQELKSIEINFKERELARAKIKPTRNWKSVKEEKSVYMNASYLPSFKFEHSSFIHRPIMEPIRPNKAGRSYSDILLVGPMNPLEMTFNHRYQYCKRITKTDDVSVNSVALDQNPNMPTTQLLVAATVNVSSISQNLLLRNTTLMPVLPGLTGIMTMLFCPMLEFRSDENRTRYAGCLSGLGTDPNQGDSVYPDHDMEIEFETIYSNEDIDQINSIRSKMSRILNGSLREDQLKEVRQDIRQSLKRLITVTRPLIDEEEVIRFKHGRHMWNNKRQNEVSTKFKGVFPPHEPLIGLSPSRQ